MKVIKFTLKGKTAFFKKPDVNTYLYFTYGTIHKIALLGVFGAILGYKGYNHMSFLKDYKKDFGKILNPNELKENSYPEFYYRLKDLKVAIVRNHINVSKKVQIFNNSVGYASKELGGNLIIKEQWLENPSWDIYIAINNDEAKYLADSLLERRFVYIPYLGKNDHLADICDVEIIENLKEVSNTDRIHSLFIKDDFQLDDSEDILDVFHVDTEEKEPKYKYEEKLPIALEESNNKYEFKTFVASNFKVKAKEQIKVFNDGDRNIVFF